jgi:transposase
LSDAGRPSLEALSRKRTASQALAERARVVLACADDGGVAPLTRVAARTGLSRESVRKWRVRFMERRMDGLGNAPRPGAARKITDEQVEVLVTRTLTEKGRGQDSHWSTRATAAETGLSQSSVSRIWRAFGLRPHVAGTWKLSTGPEFTGKVRDVADLCMSPPENALVLCRTRSRRSRLIRGTILVSATAGNRPLCLFLRPSRTGYLGAAREGDSRLQSRSRRGPSSMRLLLFLSRTRTQECDLRQRGT